MGKVSIKKNVKPRTVKQKQKQTQKTNVTVNIGSISKKRGRPKRQSYIEKKKPTQQPIYQPIVSNQPIFKQTNPQPQSLASSILATQEKPKIVSNEIKQESAITRALVEQSTNTDDPENLVNDLEKTKKKVIIPTPVKPPTIRPIPVKPSFIRPIPVKPPFITPSQTTETNSIRRSLLSQSLNDQGDDTEEIQRIKVSTLPLYPLAAAGRLGIEATSALKMGAGVASSALPYVGAGGIVLGSLGLGVASLTGSGLYSGAKSLLSSRTNEQNPLTGSYQQPPDDETKEELPILEETKDSEPPEPLTQQQPIEQTILQPPEPEPTILQQVQPEPELDNITDEDFNKYETYTQEVAKADLNNTLVPIGTIQPIQNTESILQLELIPQSSTISDESLLKKQTDVKNPSLLEPSATKSSLTQALQAEEPQVLQAEELSQATPVLGQISVPTNLTGYEATLFLHKKLRIDGIMDKKVTQDKPSAKSSTGRAPKNETELRDDIRKVTGYENWTAKPSTKGRRPNASKITQVAIPIQEASTEEGIPLTGKPTQTILEGKTVQPSIFQEDTSTIF
jgi:hypothetical protein